MTVEYLDGGRLGTLDVVVNLSISLSTARLVGVALKYVGGHIWVKVS